MTLVALALAAALILSVLGLAGVLRSLIRSHARERDLLINQILHLSGRTWQAPPPTAHGHVLAAEDFGDRYTYAPAFDTDQ
jgi:hypothetical protein